MNKLEKEIETAAKDPKNKKVQEKMLEIKAQELKHFIERIERLQDEMANIRNDIKEIFAEAKDFGYDPKIMRVCLKLRKLDEADRTELDELTKTYMEALGD